MITETNRGTGAVIEKRNEMIAGFSELVADTPTFDWEKGFDIRHRLGKEISLKDQNGSGSCGGQASSYLTEAILGGDEMSARSIYNKCFVPGGGSSEWGLMNTILNTGVDKESVTTSYENGNPPSEAFMQTPDSNPSIIKGIRPVYINVDFNTLATAVLQNNGIVIGISGQNNGTWSSADPQPPTVPVSDPSLWRHWVFVGYAGIRKGRRVLGFKNSWGNVGDNGWQYITEDYLPYIWCAWSMVYQPVDQKPKYTFTKSMNLGESSKDIVVLQDILRYEGFFNNASTGYFGPLTRQALFAFQQRHLNLSWYERTILKGKTAGPKTIAYLNSVYSNGVDR